MSCAAFASCSHGWAAHCALQVFSAVGLRHPAAGAGLQCGTFVPNTVHLGGDSPPFIVLTGPNMGGKSTLMRQVGSGTCLWTDVSAAVRGGAA